MQLKMYFEYFDFGTGDEKYKFSFGSTVRMSRNICINKNFNIKLKSLISKVGNRVSVKLKNLVMAIVFLSI